MLRVFSVWAIEAHAYCCGINILSQIGLLRYANSWQPQCPVLSTRTPIWIKKMAFCFVKKSKATRTVHTLSAIENEAMVEKTIIHDTYIAENDTAKCS